MKKALKFTFGTMLAASIAAPAFAHVDSVIDHSAVWVTATYTQPSDNGLSVGQARFANSQVGTFEGGQRAIFLDPDHDWDYALGYRYHIPGCPSHLYISYDHFHDHDSRADLNLTNIGVGPGVLPFTIQTSAEARMYHHYNEFKIGYSHGLHFGHRDRFCMDVTAFLAYDRLLRHIHEENFRPTDSEQEVAALTVDRVTEDKMRGFGPGVGIMGRVIPLRCHPSWSIFAGIENTLFYAKEEYNQQYTQNGLLGYLYNPEDSRSVVSKVDINFGLEYAHGLRTCNHDMVFDIALGMRYMNIINAFKTGNTAYNIPTANGIEGVSTNFATFTGPAQDWGRWGPYLQFSIMGAKGV